MKAKWGLARVNKTRKDRAFVRDTPVSSHLLSQQSNNRRAVDLRHVDSLIGNGECSNRCSDDAGDGRPRRARHSGATHGRHIPSRRKQVDIVGRVAMETGCPDFIRSRNGDRGGVTRRKQQLLRPAAARSREKNPPAISRGSQSSANVRQYPERRKDEREGPTLLSSHDLAPPGSLQKPFHD